MRRSPAPLAQGIEVPAGGRIVQASARTIQYHGARYVLAQDPLTAAEDNIKTLVRGVKGHAEKLFRKAGIKYKDKPSVASSGEGDQKNGIELVYNLQTGNFSGIEADLYIDYLVKSKNVMGEDANWWESAVSWMEERLRSKEERQIGTAGNYNLNQMVFRFCKGNHASTIDRSPKIGQMLETIAFLQGAGDLVVVKNARDEGKELPEGEKEASDQVIKTMNALKTKFQGKKIPGYNGNKAYPAAGDGKWATAAFWSSLFLELVNNGAMNQALAGQMTDAIQQLESEGNLANTVKNLERLSKRPPVPKSMEGPGGIREVVKTKLATIINQGPYRINYTAWDRMGIASDADGNTILKIAAPMKPYFTFEKSKGGPPKLLDASCRLCGKIFASKQGDEAAAAKLAWTGVVLGRGAALGINPIETEHQVEETWLSDLLTSLPKAEDIKPEEKKTEEKTTETEEGGPAQPGSAPIPGEERAKG
jgi:hypothetical protein